MTKIIITGASGFIGSNIHQYLIEKGYDAINLDIKPPLKQTLLRYWKKIDLLESDLLEKEIKNFQPQFVIHLAARTDLNGKTIDDYQSNTTGTKNLIDVLNKIPSVKRVIFTSSMLVCKPGYIPKNQTDYSPTTIYGESKVQMEKLIRSSSHNYEWVIVRPTSIWGPGFGEPYRNFFDLLLKKRYFHIGKKSCTKTYGYIGNIIYQISEILNTPVKNIQGNVFYLGDYEPTNIQTWANEIAGQLNTSIKRVPYLLIKSAAIIGDISKLFRINFPMTSFRLRNMTTDNIVDLSNTKEIAPDLPYTRLEGIKETLNWIKEA